MDTSQHYTTAARQTYSVANNNNPNGSSGYSILDGSISGPKNNGGQNDGSGLLNANDVIRRIQARPPPQSSSPPMRTGDPKALVAGQIRRYSHPHSDKNVASQSHIIGSASPTSIPKTTTPAVTIAANGTVSPHGGSTSGPSDGVVETGKLNSLDPYTQSQFPSAFDINASHHQYHAHNNTMQLNPQHPHDASSMLGNIQFATLSGPQLQVHSPSSHVSHQHRKPPSRQQQHHQQQPRQPQPEIQQPNRRLSIAKASQRPQSLPQFINPSASMTANPSALSRKRRSSGQASNRTSTGNAQLDDLTITDDVEGDLKRTAIITLNTPMEDIVNTTRENDKPGSVGEKARQFFGMAWLLRNCELNGEATVARNKVYARYVSNCSDYALRPLNPASFGKVVRIMFPQVKTRRLGVRGQSKYHYCGVRLANDTTDSASQEGAFAHGSMSRKDSMLLDQHSQEEVHLAKRMRRSSSTVGISLDKGQQPATRSESRARGNSPEIMNYLENSPIRSSSSVTTSSGRMSSYFFIDNWKDRIQFPDAVDELPKWSFDISGDANLWSPNFADLHEYVEPGSDIDSIMTLSGLYKVHCRSLMEAFLSVDRARFFRLIGSFVGGLTTPVRHLLKQNGVLEWITTADWSMYKEMAYLVAPVAIEDVNDNLLGMLLDICDGMVDRFMEGADDISKQFAEARKRPATAFCQLLKRLLKAHDSAMKAGEILVDVSECHKMRDGWIGAVDFQRIRSYNIPCMDPTTADSILESEVAGMLDASQWNKGNEPEMNDNNIEKTPAGSSSRNLYDYLAEGVSSPQIEGIKDKDSLSSMECALQGWASWLLKLTRKVGGAVGPRVFLLGVTAVLTSALQDIYGNNGQTFDSWWTVRSWIDEYLGFVCDLSGFLAEDFPFSDKMGGTNGMAPSSFQNMNEPEEGIIEHDSANNGTNGKSEEDSLASDNLASVGLRIDMDEETNLDSV